MSEPGLSAKAIRGYVIVAVFLAAVMVLLGSLSYRSMAYVPLVGLYLIVPLLVAHDAKSRGMSPWWGFWALTGFGIVLYFLARSRRRSSVVNNSH